MTIESLKEIDKCCQTLCDAWVVKAEIKQLEAQLSSARREEIKIRTMMRLIIDAIEFQNEGMQAAAIDQIKEYLGV